MLYTNEAIKKRKQEVNTAKKIFNIIIYIILIPILVYNLSLIIQAISNPRETPSFFGIKTYVIISGSMQPELEIGDIVIVKKVGKNQLEKGDIISFRQGQNVITHRIYEIVTEDNETKIATKGDNNNVKDDKSITYADIEGKVIKKIPKLGLIALTLKGKMTILIIAIIVYIYLIYDGIIKRKKSKRRIKRIEHEKQRWEEQYEQKK